MLFYCKVKGKSSVQMIFVIIRLQTEEETLLSTDSVTQTQILGILSAHARLLVACSSHVCVCDTC
ncbi:hypothetical protein FKM82_010021 [Ascaphus truei]